MLEIEYTHLGDSNIRTLQATQIEGCEKVEWSFDEGKIIHGGDIDTFLSILKNIKNVGVILDIHGSIDACCTIFE